MDVEGLTQELQNRSKARQAAVRQRQNASPASVASSVDVVREQDTRSEVGSVVVSVASSVDEEGNTDLAASVSTTMTVTTTMSEESSAVESAPVWSSFTSSCSLSPLTWLWTVRCPDRLLPNFGNECYTDDSPTLERCEDPECVQLSFWFL